MYEATFLQSAQAKAPCKKVTAVTYEVSKEHEFKPLTRYRYF